MILSQAGQGRIPVIATKIIDHFFSRHKLFLNIRNEFTWPQIKKNKLTPSVVPSADAEIAPVASSFFCFAKTPTVGRAESTKPMASYTTSGPKSDQNMP